MRGAALNLSPFLLFLQTRYLVAALVSQNEQSSPLLIPPKRVSSLATVALPDSAAGLSPSSCTVSGRLGLTSARKADHLLGFSVCSWEGGWQSKLQSRLGFQLLLGQGRPLMCGRETARSWPAMGLEQQGGTGHVGATACRRPARTAGKAAPEAQRVFLATRNS